MRRDTWRAGYCRLGMALLALTGVTSGEALANLPLPTGGVTVDFTGFTGAGFAPTPGAGQLDSDFWASTGMSDGAMTFGGTFTTGDFARGLLASNVSVAGFYALVESSDARLAVQATDAEFSPGTLTLRLQNTTGSALTGFRVGYELYVRNNEGRSSTFNLSYSTNGTSFTNVPTRAYTSPEASNSTTFVQ